MSFSERIAVWRARSAAKKLWKAAASNARRAQREVKSLALPLSDLVIDHGAKLRLAVILHIYYTDLVNEFSRYLENIEQPFDLVITTDTVSKQIYLRDHPICRLAVNTKIMLVANRGRDIAPKIAVLSKEFNHYEIVLFLHSKRSPHGQYLSGWRRYLLEQLLGTKASTSSIISLFEQFPHLGMVAPKNFDRLWESIQWSGNFESSKALALRFGVKELQKDCIDFPSGSMFWARPKALEPILSLKLDASDFEAETGQLDGTLAHQIERLFYISCEKSGLSWLTVARPEICKKKAGVIAANDIHQIAMLMNRKLLF
jgi:O-antigen biosynthesis protein